MSANAFLTHKLYSFEVIKNKNSTQNLKPGKYSCTTMGAGTDVPYAYCRGENGGNITAKMGKHQAVYTGTHQCAWNDSNQKAWMTCTYDQNK